MDASENYYKGKREKQKLFFEKRYERPFFADLQGIALRKDIYGNDEIEYINLREACHAK